MEIVNSIKYDMAKRGVPPVIDAVQGEVDSRVVELSVFSNGTAVNVEGYSCSLAFSKPDGTSGWYDTMPDKSTAFSVSGNVISMKIAPQVLAVPGEVNAVIRFETNGKTERATTFPFVISVSEDPAINAPKSENYYSVQNWDQVNESIEKRPGFKGLPNPENFNRLTANLGQGFYIVQKKDGWTDLPGGVNDYSFALLVFWYTQNYNVQVAYSINSNFTAYRFTNVNDGTVYTDWHEQTYQTKDHENTKVTLTVTAGQVLDLRGIYRLDNHGGVNRIDWGDGIKNNVIGTTDDEMRHTYAKAGTYTITMTGLTHIAASVFNEKNVSTVEIGSIVQFMGQMAFTACPDLTEVRIYAETPPEITTTSGGLGPFGNKNTTIALIVPENSLPTYMEAAKWDIYKDVLTTEDTRTTVTKDKVVTVGEGGDFATINDALAYLSRYYPAYKASGIKCEIQIIAGTIITEQIFVERTDLSYITITSAASDNKVQVAPSNDWGGIAHDTRGNKPFISGENGARLPCIKCLFSCIVPEGGWVTTGVTEAINCAVGYFCNRGSTGVISGSANTAGVLANVGFENFYDNIIANNNSEIVLREAYARGAARYGVMSRHISRVSARSANITNSGDTAAYADRASMLDVRHADLTGSKNGIAAYHASTVTANETVASSIPGTVADAQYGSIINCQAITAAGSNDSFKVTGGATIVATGAKVTDATGTKYSQTTNTLTENGVIYE